MFHFRELKTRVIRGTQHSQRLAGLFEDHIFESCLSTGTLNDELYKDLWENAIESFALKNVSDTFFNETIQNGSQG